MGGEIGEDFEMRGKRLFVGIIGIGVAGAVAGACAGFEGTADDVVADDAAGAEVDGSAADVDSNATTVDDAATSGLDATLRPGNDSGMAVCTATSVDAGDAGTGNKRAFLSANDYAVSDLKSVANADAICATEAELRNLGGCWKAWLSSETVGAGEHVGRAKWYTLEGKAFLAAPESEFPYNAVSNPIAPGLSPGLRAWTGSAGNGSPAVGATCASWSSDAGNARVGAPSEKSSSWSSAASDNQRPCFEGHPIYCFEQ